MSFFVDDSSLIVTHLLYKAALIIAVLRWVLSWALRIRNRTLSSSSSSSSSSCVSSDTIRDSLILTTFGDVEDRVSESCDTCAVCLSQLNERDEVRELRNCSHVFHRECIDRWLDRDQDNHKTCPLCRAPLLRDSQSLGCARSDPSWAVERLLYLFGDDLL